MHRIDLDAALRDGLYQRICAVTGQLWTREGEALWREELVNRYRPNEDEELFCIPSKGGGAWLTRALIESRMKPGPVIRFTGTVDFNNARPDLREREMQDWIEEHIKPLAKLINPELRHALGMDFGRTGDLSCIAPSEVASNLRLTIPFLVELKNVPYNQQLQVLYAVVEMLTRMSGMVIDSRGNGSYIGEAAHDKWGSVVERLMPTEGWYRDNMPPYKAAFEDDTITVPKHDGLLQSHRAIRLVRGVARMPEGKTEDGGHGDNAMACVYSHAASRMNIGPVQVGSRPRRDSIRTQLAAY
jgi:phage FluMu gp28-like protein